METVDIYDARTRLSKLVDKAASGEDVVIGRHGKPLVRRLSRSERAPEPTRATEPRASL